MSNVNQSYFDKYIDPVVREIDRVNIYEFERGMDYELIQEGGIVDPETIKKAQGKVLKNLKKDPAYYTNQLVADSVKLVGEYGSGKKPGKRNTPKDAEAVKADNKKSNKVNNADAPYGKKEDNSMKKAKIDKKFSHTKGTIKEGMDYDISNQDTSDDPAAYGHGTMRSFENQEDKDLEMIRNAMKRDVRGTKKPAASAPKNEMINVKDSRKFYMTRENVDMLKNTIKEMVAMVTSKSGTDAIDYKNPSELNRLRQDSNISSIKTTAGQKIK